MYSGRTAAHLAARVRSLLGPRDSDDLPDVAAALGVSAIELREILVHETPYPSIAVLAALVAYYGVDAGWLLTGDYSPALHRASEEIGEPPKRQLEQLLRDESVNLAEDDEQARVHLAKLLRENPGTTDRA